MPTAIMKDVLFDINTNFDQSDSRVGELDGAHSCAIRHLAHMFCPTMFRRTRVHARVDFATWELNFRKTKQVKQILIILSCTVSKHFLSAYSKGRQQSEMARGQRQQ